MDFEALVQEHGTLVYALLFAWTFLEGETCVILSGIAAKAGLLDLRLVVPLAWLGTFLGDQAVFFAGRRFGPRALGRYPRAKAALAGATAAIERHDVAFIVSFRFLYGVRNVAAVALGMSGISWLRFSVLNFFAAGVWAVAFAGAGYALGAAAERFAGHAAVGALAAAGVAAACWWACRRKGAVSGVPAE